LVVSRKSSQSHDAYAWEHASMLAAVLPVPGTATELLQFSVWRVTHVPWSPQSVWMRSGEHVERRVQY
jgi:hypothetical protein